MAQTVGEDKVRGTAIIRTGQEEIINKGTVLLYPSVDAQEPSP